MKKIILYLSLLFVLVGCDATLPPDDNSDEGKDEIVKDTIKPLIIINNQFVSITINIGENFDPLEGIQGLDNIDGDITKKIEYNAEDVNVNKEGTYEIFFYLVDSSGNQADIMTKKVKVVDPNPITRPEVFLGEIKNEAPKPPTPGLFSGAWYHKVVSASDYWCGIEGVIQLPVVDINRYSGEYDETLLVDPNARNLDNPSIYMGGNAGKESDVGLSFEKVEMANGEMSTGSVAFRPFWRYITTYDQADVGGIKPSENRYYGASVIGGSIDSYVNVWGAWRNEDSQFYYLPGDVLRMIIHIPVPNMMQFQIEVFEVSKIPSSIALREDNNWRAPENFKSPYFSAPGHGTNKKAIFKRINAIDQVGNEGKPEIATPTTITNAIWKEVYLYRKIDGELKAVPFIDQRRAILHNPLDSRFTVKEFLLNGKDLGGMIVDIHPGYDN